MCGKLISNSSNSMFKRYFLVFVVFWATISLLFAQEPRWGMYPNPDSTYDKYHLPSVSIGSSILSYFGDYGNVIPFNTKLRPGFNIGVEERFKGFLGAGVNFGYGNLSENQRRVKSNNYNFLTSVVSGDLNAYLHFDDLFIKKSSRFSSFINVGVGFMTFNPKGDLKDKNGKQYFYWPDGSIRDRVKDIENPQLGDVLVRDYKYETKLDSTNKYKNAALTIPIGLGIKFKISDRLELNFIANYYFTGTDYLDNYSANGKNNSVFSLKNDRFFNTAVTLQYNISGKPLLLTNKHYNNVDYITLGNEDSDGDGVPDLKDRCAETPKGITVDAFGCPLDDDKDGVPNTNDKELTTAPYVPVDSNGVTMSDSALYAMFLKDSLIASGDFEVFSDRPVIAEVIKPTNTSDTTSSVAVVSNNSGVDSTKTNVTPLDTTQIAVVNNPPDTTVKNTPPSNVDLLPFKPWPEDPGIVFTVQISSATIDLTPEFFYEKHKITNQIFNNKIAGLNKYYINTFNNFNDARAFKEKFSKEHNNYPCFIVAFKNGQKTDPVAAIKESFASAKMPEIKEISEEQKGIVYRVQIGSFSTPTSSQYLVETFNVHEDIFVTYVGGSYKYNVGSFKSLDDAKAYQKKYAETHPSAPSFITAYKDGSRISIQQAVQQNEK